MPERNAVIEARQRLEREIRALFPSPSRYWDNRALAKTCDAIERGDPRLRRYAYEAMADIRQDPIWLDMI